MEPTKNNPPDSRPASEQHVHVVEDKRVEVSWWQKPIRVIIDVKNFLSRKWYGQGSYKKLSDFSVSHSPAAEPNAILEDFIANKQSTVSRKALNEVKVRNLLIAIDIIIDSKFMSQALSDMHQELKSELDEILIASEQPQSCMPVTDKNIVKDVKKHSAVLMSRLAQAGIAKHNLKGLMKEKTIGSLNHKEWKQVGGVIETKEFGVLKSTQIPAAQMRLNPNSNTDIFPVSYNGSGVSSATSTSSDHAVNLWTSSLSSNDSGKVLYQGVRHGVHSAYSLEGSKRNAANIRRAKETLLAALKLKPELLQEALLYPNNPVHIDCASVSLLTPDWIRSGDSDEKKMLHEQVEAFNILSSDQPIKLEIMEEDEDGNGKIKTILVTTTMLCFNFGVNQGAVSPLLSKVVGGWGVSDSINQKGLEALIGYPDQKATVPGGLVMEYLNKLQHLITEMELEREGASEDEAKQIDKKINEIRKKSTIIIELEQQIRTIYIENLHHYDNNEAYKMPARILLLMFYIEGVPMSNCKSGKDRTGVLDAEVKLMAILCEVYGKVPDPGAPLSDEVRKLFQTLILNSGNLEIQEYNTGLKGYKTQGVKSIDDRVGNADVLREFRGGSAAVGS